MSDDLPSLTRLSCDAWVAVHQLMTSHEASEVMSALLAEMILEERSIQLFGRTVLQPRLIGWAGDIPYTYSRQTLEPREWSPTLLQLREMTEEASEQTFNHALVNLYRTGTDSMGMHSDDESELGPLPVIASWSFGETRRFVIAAKRGKARFEWWLPSGSLMVMGGSTQQDFRHGLPKTMRTVAPRLNVTFRRIAPAGSRPSRSP